MTASRINWMLPAAAIAAFLLLLGGGLALREPRFDGVSASDWFLKAQGDPSRLEDYGAIFIRWEDAGIEFLCGRLTMDPPRWKRMLIDLNNRIGTKVGLKPLPMDNTYAERQTARRLLGYFEAQAAPALLELLDSAGTKNRPEAIRAMAELGPAAAPLIGPRLLPLLNDPSVEIAYEAMTTLAVVGYEPRTVIPLLIPFLNHTNQRMRIEASYALGSYPLLPESSLVPFMAALDDPDMVVRANSARALGAMGAGAAPALDRLGRLLLPTKGPSALDSARAVEAIARIARQVPQHLREEFETTHARHLAGGDAYNRLMVLHASVELGWPVDQLEATSRNLLRASQNWQVWETVAVLAKLNPRPDWVQPLLEEAAKHPNGFVRAQAREALEPRAR